MRRSLASPSWPHALRMANPSRAKPTTKSSIITAKSLNGPLSTWQFFVSLLMLRSNKIFERLAQITKYCGSNAYYLINYIEKSHWGNEYGSCSTQPSISKQGIWLRPKKGGKRRVQDFRLVKSSSRSNFYQKFSAISKVFSSFRVAEDGLKMLTLDYVAVGIQHLENALIFSQKSLLCKVNFVFIVQKLETIF